MRDCSNALRFGTTPCSWKSGGVFVGYTSVIRTEPSLWKSGGVFVGYTSVTRTEPFSWNSGGVFVGYTGAIGNTLYSWSFVGISLEIWAWREVDRVRGKSMVHG